MNLSLDGRKFFPRKIKWDEIPEIFQDVNFIYRTLEVQNNYQKHIDFLKKQNMTALDNIKTIVPNNTITIIPNDFPYNTEKNVLHYVVWCRNVVPTKQEIVSEIEKFALHNDFEDFIFFQNPPSLQSIPELLHYHLFLKTFENF